MALLRHILIAALISFGLSVGFWLGLGVFDLQGFVIVSSGVALAGALAGLLFGGRLAVTAGVTLVLRVGVFLAVAGLPPY